MFDILLMYALFASTFSFNKILLNSLSPLFLTGITALGGGLILFLYVWYKTSIKTLLSLKSWSRIIPIALCITFGANTLRMYALSYLPSFYISFFIALDPIFTSLLCYFLRSEQFTWNKIAGTIAATIGSIPIFFFYSNASAGNNEIYILPIIAALIGVLINRYGWIRVQDLIKEGEYSITQISCRMFIIGAFIALTASGLFESNSYKGSSSIISILFYVILANNLLTSNIYIGLTKKYGITFLSLTEFITPIFVALYGSFFLKEQITWHFFVSMSCVILGLCIFNGPINIKRYFKRK